MTEKLHVKEIGTLLRLEPQLRTADERTLSVYLPIRSEGFEANFYDIQLRHGAGEIRDKLDHHQCEVLDRELPRFHDHLNLLRPAGCPGIAGFANESQGLLAVVRLPESVEARLEGGPPPAGPPEL